MFDESVGLPKVLFEGSDNLFKVHLLYRPGHYDLLYKNGN